MRDNWAEAYFLALVSRAIIWPDYDPTEIVRLDGPISVQIERYLAQLSPENKNFFCLELNYTKTEASDIVSRRNGR